MNCGKVMKLLGTTRTDVMPAVVQRPEARVHKLRKAKRAGRRWKKEGRTLA